LRSLGVRGVGAVCSRGGNAVAWGRGSVRAGGCGRVDGVARRVKDRAGGSRVVRDRCLNFLRALVGDSWVPKVGLTRVEFLVYLRALAKECDRFEFQLTGEDRL
jgi:hypothetical protein